MNKTILVVEDDLKLAQALRDALEMEELHVVQAQDGIQAMDVLAQQEVALVLSDVQMARMDGYTLLQQIGISHPCIPVVLMTAYGTITKAVAAMQAGAVDYLVKPFAVDVLLTTVRRHMGMVTAQDTAPVAVDPKTRALLGLAQRVAKSDATVLISGESGTGKEVIARYIHDHSARATGPFVAINCAAIPENMLEAMLFGHEKGAFTGAHKALPGKFEQAQQGTLLLDEVAELDLGLQAKLLRVLQEREVERLGGGRPIALDVRVVAATNRDLRAAVAAGQFREDLYYRLNVFPLILPALRERPGDILPLTARLLAQAARRMGRRVPSLDEAAQQHLVQHTWPGNVRELENILQRALILQGGDEIHAADLLFEDSPVVPAEAPAPLSDSIKDAEYRTILDALRLGNRQAAANRLGISERTLRYKLARLRDEGYALPL